MRNSLLHPLTKPLAVLTCLLACAAPSAWATVVTWNFDPSSTEGVVASTNQTFISSGHSNAAYGYIAGNPDTPLGLYYKTSGADFPGLGIVGTADQQLQGNGWFSASFPQLDVSSILAQGLSGGKIQVGNVYDGESFVLSGSDSLGDPGEQIGGVSTSSSGLVFIDPDDMANYNFLSMVGVNGGVLPVAFQATLAPVPEMRALFPVVGLIAAISVTQLLRRRRIAQQRASSSGGR